MTIRHSRSIWSSYTTCAGPTGPPLNEPLEFPFAATSRLQQRQCSAVLRRKDGEPLALLRLFDLRDHLLEGP